MYFFFIFFIINFPDALNHNEETGEMTQAKDIIQENDTTDATASAINGVKEEVAAPLEAVSSQYS